jgi:NAD(P)-dependent dehydrogenase (short-subunit alcohol dehydrogenase family)
MKIRKKALAFLKRQKTPVNEPGNARSPKGADNAAERSQDGKPEESSLLAGKNVLISGAGRNIGRSIALAMAEQGATVFFTNIDEAACRKLGAELSTHNVNGRGFVSDVTRMGDIDDLCRRLEQEHLAVDILVHNAGIQLGVEHAEDLDITAVGKVFHTNVLGPLYLTKRVVRMMASTKIHGSVLFITSIHQSVPSRWMSYSASKAALRMIIRELALDLAEKGIRVNGIAPGWVDEDEGGKAYPFNNAPLHRSSINPRYIGRAAVYLSSEYFSKFTTGTVLTIDAGLSLHSYLTLRDE